MPSRSRALTITATRATIEPGPDSESLTIKIYDLTDQTIVHLMETLTKILKHHQIRKDISL